MSKRSKLRTAALKHAKIYLFQCMYALQYIKSYFSLYVHCLQSLWISIKWVYSCFILIHQTTNKGVLKQSFNVKWNLLMRMIPTVIILNMSDVTLYPELLCLLRVKSYACTPVNSGAAGVQTSPCKTGVKQGCWDAIGVNGCLLPVWGLAHLPGLL